MPFMHPWIFAVGAGAASVPVIIHLLNRRRYRVLDWAAMKFLLESVRKNRRRIRIEEMILLALRCLAILLLAVAVGRFMGCGAAGGISSVVGTPTQTAHVFILDDSVSMGQKVGDSSGFQAATEDLADLLERVRENSPSDRVAVLLTSRPERERALFRLNVIDDPESLLGRIKTLSPSDTTGRLPEALDAAAEMLDPVTYNKRVYVLSDFRKVDFGDRSADKVRRRLARLSEGAAELRMLDYGPGQAENLTIESIEVLDKLAVAGAPIRVQVRVRNNGARRAENVSVSFGAYAGGEERTKLPVRTIRSIDPGATELVQTRYAFPDAGSGVLIAELPADKLAGDNTAYLAVNVRPARRVLIVDGEPDLSYPPESESHFLRWALDPRGDRTYGNDVDVISHQRLADAAFGDYDAILLANVSEFPMTADARGEVGYFLLDALARYVKDGGGLVIFTGDRVNPTFYNGPFYEEGRGLLPLKIRSLPRELRPAERKEFVRLLRESVAEHPVMRTFSGRLGQFTQLLRFYGYTPTESPPATAAGEAGPVKILARFDNEHGREHHSPAVAVRPYGDGQVLLVTTSADTEWNDWAKDFTYLPFVNDAVEFVSRPGAAGFSDRVGRPLDYALSGDMLNAAVTVQTPAFPEEDIRTLEPREAGPQRLVTYEGADHAGIYRLRMRLAGDVETVLFARNVDPVEGRLAAVEDADQLRGLLGGVEFVYQDRLAPAAAGEELTRTERSEYWKAALALMLIVLAIEVFLGQKFGHYTTT